MTVRDRCVSVVGRVRDGWGILAAVLLGRVGDYGVWLKMLGGRGLCSVGGHGCEGAGEAGRDRGLQGESGGWTLCALVRRGENGCVVGGEDGGDEERRT